MNIIKYVDTAKQEGGVTAQWPSGKLKCKDDAWYFPALPDETVITSEDTLEKALDNFLARFDSELQKDDRYLGICFDKEANRYHIDVNCRVEDTAKAIEMANTFSANSTYKIKSIYNIRRDTEIAIDA